MVLLLSQQVSSQSDIWAQKDTVNGQPRSVASAFVAGGDGFTLCGLDPEGFRRKVYSYTDWQDDWDDEPSVGGDNGSGLSRGSASAFGIGNYGYICLGQGVSNPFFQDLWQFDPVTNVWTQKADFIGSPRRQAVAFAIGDTAYVGTGMSATGYCKDMFKYDPQTNTWTQLSDFGGSARKEAVGFTMGGQGYVGTGDDGVKKNDFWQYEPTTDTWTQRADFPGTPRKGAVGFGLFPQAFIGTGEDINLEYTKDLWEYNYYGDVWVQRADLIGPGRTNAFAFVLNNVAYVGTGYNGSYLDDFYAYYKATGAAGISEMEQSISVFPNPVVSTCTIKTGKEEVELSLFQLNGASCIQLVDIQQEGQQFTLNRGLLPAGTYILQINDRQTKQALYTKKLTFV